MKTRLETSFIGDNVKAMIKRQIMKNWSFISLRKFGKLQHLLCFFCFSVTKQSLENVFWLQIPTLPASLKIERHISTNAAFGNSVLFLIEILVRCTALVSS